MPNITKKIVQEIITESDNYVKGVEEKVFNDNINDNNINKKSTIITYNS